MGKFNLDDYEVKPQKFNLDDYEVKQPIAPVTSVVRQLAQGASGGLSDELAGGLEAAGRVVGLNGVGGPVKDISINKEGPTFSLDDIQKAYQTGRDHERTSLKNDLNENPITSSAANILGSVVSPINKITKGMSAAKAGLTLGGVYGFGNSEANNASDLVKDTATGAAMGGAVGKTIDVASPYIKNGFDSAGKALKSTAEKLAVKATGATGKQSEKFAENAGRELLDRGIVQFGDDAEKIASKSNLAIKNAENTIDSSLEALDNKGVTVSVDKIVKNLEDKIENLKKDPSQASVVKKLQTMIDDIYETGNSNVKISDAEITKRGYNKVARNWLDPEQGQAGKTAYLAYKEAVEESAKAANPEIAKQFVDAKKSFGLLNPIADAAEKRAATLNQSPIGGLLDMATAGAGGAAVGGPAGLVTGVGAAAARRLVAPKLAASAAVTTDKISKALLSNSELVNVYKQNPAAFENIVESVRAGLSSLNQNIRTAEKNDSAKNEAPKKGPEKWANDGAQKIVEHDQTIDQSTIDQLKNSKKGRDLLIKASDLKAGSPQMDKIVNQIRNGSLMNGEE